MIHNMEITSSGTQHKVVIDGVDVSDKVSRLFMSIDSDGLPEVHLICTPMKIAIEADDVKIVEHKTKLKGQKEQKQTVLDSIDEIRDQITDYEMRSRTEYEEGKHDGLSVAYEIVSEGWET